MNNYKSLSHADWMHHAINEKNKENERNVKHKENSRRKQPPPVKPQSLAAEPWLLRSRSGGTSSSSESGSKFVTRSNSTTMQRKASVSPSAWALSPGRFSPAVTAAPPKSPPRSNRSFIKNGVLKYFRQRKVSPVHQEEYHQLRVMYNRLMQWRFANARTEASVPSVNIAAQNKLLNVWLRISIMRKRVVDKRIKMQQMKQEIKLARIFNSSQCGLLRDWARIEARNCEAIGRLARKLSAISVCLPLVDDAQVRDVESLKDAIDKAEEVMRNIEDLIKKMQWQVEQSCHLLSQIIPILKQEKLYIEELHQKISTIITSEVEEESLRVHHMQQLWELKRGV